MIIISKGGYTLEKFIRKTFTFPLEIIELIEEVQILTKDMNMSSVVRKALLIGLNQMKGVNRNA